MSDRQPCSSPKIEVDIAEDSDADTGGVQRLQRLADVLGERVQLGLVRHCVKRPRKVVVETGVRRGVAIQPCECLPYHQRERRGDDQRAAPVQQDHGSGAQLGSILESVAGSNQPWLASRDSSATNSPAVIGRENIG